MRALPQKAWYYLASLWSTALILAFIVLLLLIDQQDVQSPLIHLLSALIFAVMLAVADLTTFDLGDDRTVSIAVSLLITGMTALNWPYLILVIVLGTLSASLGKDTPWWRICTTIAVRCLAVTFAKGIELIVSRVDQLIPTISQDPLPYTTLPTLLGLLLTGAVIYMIEQAAEAGLIAFSENRPLRASWRGRLDDLRWYALMLAPLGGLLATLWAINGFTFMLGIVPLVIVQRALRNRIELNQRSSEVENLAANYRALNSKLERLQSLAITLIATRDVQTMLETLCNRLAALLGASAGWVVLLNEEHTPQMVAWHNLPVEPDGRGPYPVPSPQSYDLVLSNQRVLVFADDQRTMTLAPLDALSADWFWNALIVIPLVIDEHTTATTLGAICLAFEQIRGLDKNEQRILTAFARQAALSLENVRLFLRVQESQAELIQSSKLAAVGTFAAGTAHEFNNLLAGMLGYAQIGLTSESVQEKNESLKVVVDACKRGKSITNSLLTFARRQEPSRERELGDMRGAVEDTLTLMEIELRRCNITVERHIMPVPCTVCDLGQISQVFLNLLTNARDAMKPDGGKLIVELDSDDAWITLRVRDTGCGIPESIRDKIFEPFVTTKGALGGSGTPGTGLGLAVSYGIVKEHGGAISIESTLGKGTGVTVRLPVTTSAQPTAVPLPDRENGHRIPPLHILVVDDDPTIGEMLQRMLERTGHSIVVVQDGAMALHRYSQERFDLVLTDLAMPGMHGVELVRQLHVLNPNVMVLVLTGQPLEDQVESALAAGALSVLHKPFELQEFLDIIETAWQKRTFVPAPSNVSSV